MIGTENNLVSNWRKHKLLTDAAPALEWKQKEVINREKSSDHEGEM